MPDDKKRQLGQFFTPPEVVRFMFDAVRPPRGSTVIDPSCGDGAFLVESLRRGAGLACGIDMDHDLLQTCRQRTSGHGDRVRLYCQDGLAPLDADDLPAGFDLVIGNPPFSGGKHRRALGAAAVDYELYRPARQRQRTLFAGAREPLGRPIEALFLERFIRLARPGGRIAVILPEGIFANARMRPVREFVLEHCSVDAVVALPRTTFRGAGTYAKSAILIMTRGRRPRRPSLLAVAESLDDLDVIQGMMR